MYIKILPESSPSESK